MDVKVWIAEVVELDNQHLLRHWNTSAFAEFRGIRVMVAAEECFGVLLAAVRADDRAGDHQNIS